MSHAIPSSLEHAKPYWCDPRYMEAILARFPPTTFVLAHTGATPLLVSSIANDQNILHAASPPGFLGARQFSGLEKQIYALSSAVDSGIIATAFVQYCGDEGRVELEKKLRGLLNSRLYLIEERCRVWVDLDGDDIMLQKSRKDTRNRLRQIMKANAYSVACEYDEDFYDLYGNIAQQNNFSEVYRYSRDDLRKMIKAQGVFGVSISTGEGAYAGGAVLGHVSAREVDYILSAYDPAYPNAGRAVLWYSLMHARELGYKSVNLGGGVSESDSLFDYKMSFGGRAENFYTIKIVLDEALYRRAYGVTGDINLEGRFPV